MTRRVALASCIVLVALLLGGTTGLAGFGDSAAPPIAPAPQTGAANGAAPDTEDGHCITGPDMPLRCFKTEAAMISFLSGGKIQLEPGESALSLGSAQLVTLNIYALLYEHPNRTGEVLAISDDNCSGWNNMPGGWNDRISSTWVANGCSVTLFEHYNLTGTSFYSPAPGHYYVGDAFNDKASSWRLP